jgi:hypothetical protein
VYKVLDHFLPIIVKIRLPLWNLELGHFLGRSFFWPLIFQPQIYFKGKFWVLQPRIWPPGNSNEIMGAFQVHPGVFLFSPHSASTPADSAGLAYLTAYFFLLYM